MTSLGFRQRREQRLRLSDLGHFRRRRKAFERRREDGVGFGRAGGRLVELGERKRGAQFEAARALLLRDRDGGQESFFRRRGVGGVAFEQDFAARPMQFRFECAIAMRVACRQRFVEDCDGARRIARLSFGLSQRNLEWSVEQRTFCSRSSSTPRRMSASPAPSSPLAAVAKPSRNTPNARSMGRSCSRASRASSTAFGAARMWSPRINSNKAAWILPERERADMGEVRDPRLHAVDERSRAIDLAERPQRMAR